MKQFPDHIPVFPLSGVIYFPKTNLPLNIFEEKEKKFDPEVVYKGQPNPTKI